MGKVLKATGADAYVEYTLPVGHSALCLSWGLAFDDAALAFWTDPGNPASGLFAQLVKTFSGGTDQIGGVLLDPAMGFFSGVWNDPGDFAFGNTPAPVADAWIDCQYNRDAGGVAEFYIEGALVFSGNVSSNTIRKARFGQVSGWSDAASTAYIRDVLIGTTPGAGDIFTDDFSSGDLSAWTATSGDVSVVDDPFTGSALAGINIAFDNDALDEDPTWVRIDDPDGYRLITGWSTRRGKDDNLDKSATGTATLKGVDLTGTLDPTNTAGPFYGQLGSQKPAIILIQHPFTLEWHSVFRGFVDRYNHDLDMWTDDRGIDTFEIDLYDGFGYLSRVELMPGVHGDPVSITDFPNIYYPGTPSNLADEADVFVHVDDRIVKLLDDAGWPNPGEKRNGLRDIFSGNVSVQGSVVDRGDGLMSALGDAVDAEFPGKANHYMSKDGVYSFRGRFAFVNPSNPGYGINTWDTGTATIARADSGVAAISGLRFTDQELINSCIALPQGVDDADVPGNLVEDAGSIMSFGRSGATFPDLIVSAGHTDATPTTAVEECFKYGDFYVGNQADQRTIVTGLSFIGVTDEVLGPAIWDLMCGVEIGDVVNLTTTHPGDGGFDEELRVDNIAYTSEVGQPLRMELEVSPQPDYNPFGDIDVGAS